MTDSDPHSRDDRSPGSAAGPRGERPDKAAAAERADQIAYARDHPVASIDRPSTVKWGCAMTWVGAVFVAGYAVVALSIDENSEAFGDDLTRSEIHNAVNAYHDLGYALGIWAGLLVVFAYFAFRGIRWAGTVLLSMAVLVGLLAIVALVTPLAAVGVLVAAYSIEAGYLVRRSAASREWYAELRAAAAAKA